MSKKGVRAGARRVDRNDRNEKVDRARMESRKINLAYKRSKKCGNETSWRKVMVRDKVG